MSTRQRLRIRSHPTRTNQQPPGSRQQAAGKNWRTYGDSTAEMADTGGPPLPVQFMALKSTVYKFDLNVADLDRQVYGDFPLTLARHPSETEARMMLRLLAFALDASEELEFGRGISTDNEPDLWRKSLTGEVELWIELGTPDPERLRKACGRADAVKLYCYGDRATPVWWKKHSRDLERFDRLRIWQVDDATSDNLASLAAGGHVQCTIESGEAWISAAEQNININLTTIK